ncbi:hypothetical protein KJ564_00490 [bacterium]|nr:hypothetical protein [bacterium]
MNDTSNQQNATSSEALNAEEMVSVVDRKGQKKEMTRPEYEKKKRRKRKREKSSGISFRTILSMLFIIALMFVAALIALKIVG